MQPQTTNDYATLLSEVIKKQIVILGPDITLAKARNVPGLTVDNTGTVTGITGEPQQITQSLIDQFVQLSGLIVKKTMEPLFAYHAAGQLPAQPVAPAVSQPVQMPGVMPQMPITQTPVAMSTQAQPVQNLSQPIEQAQTPIAPVPSSSSPLDPTTQNTQNIINEALKQG